jgi:Lon protease-like protein
VTDATSLLPIFPLPNVVLFPDVQVPLFIFEPRYRQMTAAALEGDRRIGMVGVEPAIAPPSERESSRSSNPPVFRIGCEGEILKAELHDDGTYHILLHGRRRFRIREEIPSPGDRLYRLARIEPLDEAGPADDSAAGLTAQRSTILDLMSRLAPDRAQHFRPELFASFEDVRFVNAFCQAVDIPTLEKQQLLEANGVRARAQQLVSLLRFQLAERSAAASASAGTVH